MAVIAYLGPELPALSATFVHEELLGLERRGWTVRPFSVRRPATAAPDAAELAQRTEILYDRSPPRVVVAGLAALASAGWRVIGAVRWLGADMLVVGPHRLAAWKLVYQWLAAARLARRLRQTGCTHLHVHFAHTPAQIAMYASALSGIPFTITAHANDIFERGLLLADKARRSTRMLAISEYNVAFLRSVGVPADKLTVVRCGVSFAPRDPVPDFQARRHYRIGTLCRLVEKKGVDDLIRALSLLSDDSWSAELSIAGDGPERPRLERLCRDLAVENRVEFAGALGHGEVKAWLQSLDVFVLACKKDANGDMDGIPVSLMEAMSQYVPVVSTRLSGIPELVVHERSGLLAMPGDPAGLAREVRRLLDDPALRARLAYGGAAHIHDEFDQDVNLDRLLRYVAP